MLALVVIMVNVRWVALEVIVKTVILLRAELVDLMMRAA